MKEHVTIGHGILLSAELPVEAEWVLHHHERFDGTGYSAGLTRRPRFRSSRGSSPSRTRSRR